MTVVKMNSTIASAAASTRVRAKRARGNKINIKYPSASFYDSALHFDINEKQVLIAHSVRIITTLSFFKCHPKLFVIVAYKLLSLSQLVQYVALKGCNS